MAISSSVSWERLGFVPRVRMRNPPKVSLNAIQLLNARIMPRLTAQKIPASLNDCSMKKATAMRKNPTQVRMVSAVSHIMKVRKLADSHTELFGVLHHIDTPRSNTVGSTTGDMGKKYPAVSTRDPFVFMKDDPTHCEWRS
jgi:hypothetical protein